MILVAGATGNVGGALVRELATRGAPVRGLSRSGEFRGDLNDPPSLRPALAGVSAVFMLSGYPPEIFTEARDAGVRHVVLMSGGSAETGDRSNAVARYMIDTEDALRESGLAWTILRPRTFMSNALQWAGQVRAGVVRAPWPDVAVAAVDPADIAAVAAVALTEPGHEGREYRVTGPEPLRPADRVRLLGDALGRAVRYEAQPDDEARAEMSAQMPQEYVDAFFSFFSDGKLDESQVFPTVAEVTGRAPRTFARWATDNVDSFR
ncbi:NAD(P)H-binding protein [Actinophytocola sp. NPDC049390]|uniref:NAD(P)H-binding protein n=1 Tax=Actinophytocola sp. NPDC049390 TaxID=3363894 RepID=UPI0037B18793